MYNNQQILKVKGNKARIVLISCIHIGHICHSHGSFKKWVKEEILQPDTWFINLGDTCDNGTKHAPGASIWEQTKNPKEQAIEAMEILGPLYETGKCLGQHQSNHSIRTFKDSGFFTVEEWICDKLKTKWLGWQALNKLIVTKRNREQSYIMHSMHGTGGGTAIQSAISQVFKQSQIADADLYVRGHHHRIASVRGEKFQYSEGRARPKKKDILFVTTGCYLDYEESYGEMSGYYPCSVGSAVVELYVSERKMRAVT